MVVGQHQLQRLKDQVRDLQDEVLVTTSQLTAARNSEGPKGMTDRIGTWTEMVASVRDPAENMGVKLSFLAETLRQRCCDGSKPVRSETPPGRDGG